MYESTYSGVMSSDVFRVAATARPTVVLLHSSASSSRQWERLASTLADGFRVEAVDLYGHGARPAWHGHAPYTLADDAALVAPLLRVPGGAHLVGHSYGAAVALKVLELYPARVRSVVAYEPVMFRWLAGDAAAQDVNVLTASIRVDLARDDEASAARRFVDFWSGAGAWHALPAGRQQAVAMRMRSVLNHFEALFRDPLEPATLARLNVPQRYLAGANTVPATACIARILRRSLPRANHAWLEGMGHLGPITHATDVNRRIAAYIAEHAGSEPALA